MHILVECLPSTVTVTFIKMASDIPRQAEQLRQYYQATASAPIRPDLELAATQLLPSKVAIDCGCGAGSNTAYLASMSYTVHAFDIEDEAIQRCRDRFRNNDAVQLSRHSFTSFNYPKASLVLAEASLFFCAKHDFGNVWRSITDCLEPQGLFCGSFLGPQDTMAIPNHPSVLWQEVLILEENDIKDWLSDYDILHWTEHEHTGQSSLGEEHHWHIFSVVAKKKR